MDNSPGISPAETPYPAEWSRFARRSAAIALVGGLLYVLTLIKPILPTTTTALILAFLLLHPVQALARRTRLSYTLSVVIVFLVYLAVGLFVVVRIVAPLVAFVSSLGTALQVFLTGFIQFLRNYTPDQGWFLDPDTGARLFSLNFILEPLSRMAQGHDLGALVDVIPNLFNSLTSMVGTLGNALLFTLMVNILTLIFLLEMPLAFRFIFFKLIPPAHRRETALLVQRAGKLWTGFIRGSLVSGLLTGILTYIQLVLMGIPNALLVSLITGSSSVIPILGGFIGAVPLIIVPLFQGSTVFTETNPIILTIWVSLIYYLIQGVLWNTIIPKIFGDAVSLPISFVILGIAVGTAVAGILGAFLAVPIIAIIREIVAYVLKKIRGGDPYPGEPTPDFLTQGIFVSPPPSQVDPAGKAA